jgi:DNA-binding FadR family transcriptional regulator
MREVLQQLSTLGLVPVIHGTGLLSKQSPMPGQNLAKGSSVDLTFKPSS